MLYRFVYEGEDEVTRYWTVLDEGDNVVEYNVEEVNLGPYMEDDWQFVSAIAEEDIP